MDKKTLTEADICSKFVTPALITAGWDQTQIREQRIPPTFVFNYA
jgi:type I restriction enzyme R subunit